MISQVKRDSRVKSFRKLDRNIEERGGGTKIKPIQYEHPIEEEEEVLEVVAKRGQLSAVINSKIDSRLPEDCREFRRRHVVPQ